MESHAYNKGKALVVSKVPLPNYRADLDDRHGSTQKEISMSTEVEKRVGNLLNTAGQSELAGVDASSSASSLKIGKFSSRGVSANNTSSTLKVDPAEDTASAELKRRHEKMKVLLHLDCLVLGVFFSSRATLMVIAEIV
ncbi:unnamed protein product [Rhodiola kirilowii]